MIEIFNSIYIFIFFTLLTLFPINIFNKKISDNNLYSQSFNMLINLNILFLFSLLPFSILDLKIHFIILIFFIIFFAYCNKNSDYKRFFKKDFLLIYFIFLIVFFILTSNVLNNLFLEWDGQKFYLIKSIIFFQGGTFNDLKTFEYNYFHPHYGQYLWAFFARIGFIENEVFGRVFYIALYCFSILFVSSKLKVKDYLKLSLFVLLILLSFDYDLFAGWQEIILFSLLTLSAVYLFNLYENKKNIFDLISLFLISNILIWTKAEGFVYAFIILSLIVLSKISVQKKLFSILTIFSLILLKYLIFYITEFDLDPRPVQYNIEYVASLDFTTIFSKLKTIFIFLTYYLTTNELMILNILVFASIIFFKSIKTKNIKFIYHFFIFNYIFLIFVYISNSFDTEYLMRTTAERLIFSTSGFYLFSLIYFINEFKFYKKL